MAATRACQASYSGTLLRPASRQAERTSSGISNGACGQPRYWRAASVSSLKSRPPWAARAALDPRDAPPDGGACRRSSTGAGPPWPRRSRRTPPPRRARRPPGRASCWRGTGRPCRRTDARSMSPSSVMRLSSHRKMSLPRPQVPGQRDHLLADALLQAAVADQRVGAVIDDAGAEPLVQEGFGHEPCRRRWRCPGRAGRSSTSMPQAGSYSGCPSQWEPRTRKRLISSRLIFS